MLKQITQAIHALIITVLTLGLSLTIVALIIEVYPLTHGGLVLTLSWALEGIVGMQLFLVTRRLTDDRKRKNKE